MNLLQRLAYKLLYKVSGELPLRVIDDKGNPYLERYYLGTSFNRRWYLHRFVASDPARGWHDHPWHPAYSLVLWGEYGEERCVPHTEDYYSSRVSEFWHTRLNIQCSRVRWWNRLDKYTAHRVVIGDDWSPSVRSRYDVAHQLGLVNPLDMLSSRSPECWTLFTSPVEYTNAWGFWNKLVNKHSIFNWEPFDGKSGTASSGEWWRLCVLGKFNSKRQPTILC
jgi:hypothetical protein